MFFRNRSRFWLDKWRRHGILIIAQVSSALLTTLIVSRFWDGGEVPFGSGCSVFKSLPKVASPVPAPG